MQDEDSVIFCGGDSVVFFKPCLLFVFFFFFQKYTTVFADEII